MLPLLGTLQKSNALFIAIIVLLLVSHCKAQHTPTVPCPSYFQYANDNYGVSGRITLRNMPVQTVKLDADFTQLPRLGNYYGALTLVNDLQTTYNILQRTNEISYHVDFPNKSTYPKLTALRVNGITICTGPGDGPFSSTFQLTHSFIPTTSSYFVPTYTQVSNQNPFLQNAINALGKPIYQTPSLQPQPSPYPTPTSNRRTTPPRATPPRQPQPEFGNPGDAYNTGNTFNGNPWFPRPNTDLLLTSRPLKPETETTMVRRPSKPSIPSPRPQKPEFESNSKPVNQPQTSGDLGTLDLRWNDLAENNRRYPCGKEGVAQFIFKGEYLERGKFPWLSAIYVKTPSAMFKCGGSLISQRTVITAAHCVADAIPSQYFVTVGRHDLTDISPTGNDVRDLANIIVNPDFDENRLPDADIALLHLAKPVAFSPQLRPVCVWDDEADEITIVGKRGKVAGWGKHEKGDFTPRPKALEIDITDRETCRERHTDLASTITRRTLCAGNGDGSGICRGDSGGGLMIHRSGAWYIRGIVSGGPLIREECDLLGFGFYTDIAYHRKWVTENIVT